MDIRTLVLALALTLAGCAGDEQDPADTADVPVVPTEPMANAPLHHLRWNTTADAPVFTLRMTVDFGVENTCVADLAFAARPLAPGGWSMAVWQARGEGAHDIGTATPRIDYREEAETSIAAYRVGDVVVSSSSANGDRDIAGGATWDGRFVGLWDLTIVTEDLHAWDTELTKGDAGVVDLRCASAFAVHQLVVGHQGLVATFADGSGIGAQAADGHVLVLDEVGLDLDGSVVNGMQVGRIRPSGPGVGVGIATFPGGSTNVPLAPPTRPDVDDTFQRTFEAGAGAYAFSATSAALSDHVLTFYAMDDEVRQGAAGWTFA